MADSGYTNEDRKVIASCAPREPKNPMLLAIKSAVVATLGTDDDKAAWLRTRGWILPMSDIGSGSWRRKDSSTSLTVPMAQAIAQQLAAELSPFKWMIKSDRVPAPGELEHAR